LIFDKVTEKNKLAPFLWPTVCVVCYFKTYCLWQSHLYWYQEIWWWVSAVLHESVGGWRAV